MTTPDEHLKVLRGLLSDAEDAVAVYGRPSLVQQKFQKRAEALRWILEQNTYGVTEDEVVG